MVNGWVLGEIRNGGSPVDANNAIIIKYITQKVEEHRLWGCNQCSSEKAQCSGENYQLCVLG
jgi:hypothetical protein